MAEWISVKDRLPPRDQVVLCTDNEIDPAEKGILMFESIKLWYIHPSTTRKVTHWKLND